MGGSNVLTLSDIKAHLVQLVICAVLIAGGIWGVETLIARHDAANDAKWQLQLKQIETSNAAEIAAITSANQQLLQTISTRNQSLTVSQQKDHSSPAPIIAQKLGGTAINAQTIDLPLSVAQNITASLEAIPVLQANLADETTIATNETKLVSDLQTQLKVEDSACKASIADLKAHDRRSKFKWFIAGLAAGFTLGIGHVL